MERQLYEDWLVDGMTSTLSSSFVRKFQSKSLVEIRWATVVDSTSTKRTARPKPKVAKVTQILPTLAEEHPSSEDDDDDVSSYLSLQLERMYRSMKEHHAQYYSYNKQISSRLCSVFLFPHCFLSC